MLFLRKRSNTKRETNRANRRDGVIQTQNRGKKSQLLFYAIDKRKNDRIPAPNIRLLL